MIEIRGRQVDARTFLALVRIAQAVGEGLTFEQCTLCEGDDDGFKADDRVPLIVNNSVIYGRTWDAVKRAWETPSDAEIS